jgi:rRNA-processing protein FCF1
VAPTPQPEPEPIEDPTFVRQASPAERKAALEAILAKEGVRAIFPTVSTPPPSALPSFVRETSPAQRKAAVEQLIDESGVTGALAKAPWKRPSATPPTPPPAPDAPPAPRLSPKLAMTKAPFESATGKSPPRIVILDTNALMMQFQFHIDIEKEVRRLLSINFDIVVPRIVLDELSRLAKEGTAKEQGEARMALALANTFRLEESPGDGDTGILRLAERLNALVVTNDKTLRARLRAKDIPSIYMRSRAFLTIEGNIPGM